MANQLFDLPDPMWSASLTVRRINATTAADWISRYHYSGRRNPSSSEYGVFAPDLIAVVSVGEAANAFGVQRKFGLEKWRGNKEITRVAVHPASPKNTATQVVALTCKEIARGGVEWVFSYADTGQGHHGGIYQGLNAVYVGISPARAGFLLDGVAIHPRTLVAVYGTMSRTKAMERVEAAGHTLEIVEDMNTAKHLYVLPIGKPAARRAIRQHLKRFAQRYPKRMG